MQLLVWILAWGIGLACFVSFVAAAAMGRQRHGRPTVTLAIVLILAAVYGALSNMATDRGESLHGFLVAAGSVPTGPTRTVAAALDVAHYAAAVALTTALLALGSSLDVLPIQR